MVTYAPSNQRLDAIFRILLAALYSWTLYPIVSTIGLIGGAVFMLIDVILQLVKGDSGAGSSNLLTGWGERLFQWPLEQLTYIVGTNKDGFPVLP